MLTRQRKSHSYYRDVHYYVSMSRPPPSYWLRRLFGEKMNMFIFRRIEVESQSNRNCNCRLSRLIRLSRLGRSMSS